MMFEAWLGYVFTVALIVFAPGPSVLLVSSHRLRYGGGSILPTVAGDLSANVLQMTTAGCGLAVLIQASFRP